MRFRCRSLDWTPASRTICRRSWRPGCARSHFTCWAWRRSLRRRGGSPGPARRGPWSRCYCASPFVLGVGGDDYSIGGMTFTSHIAPAAITLLAFALLELSGLVRCGAGGWHRRALLPRLSRARVGRLLLGRPDRSFAVFSSASASRQLLVGGSVLLLSEPANGRGLVGTDPLRHPRPSGDARRRMGRVRSASGASGPACAAGS